MLKFDSNKILNSASKIDKGKKTLQNAKNNLKNFDIPNDFRYGSELKKCIDNIQNMAKYTEDLSKWMQKKVGLFNNTQKKMIKSVANLNDTFDLKLIGTNIYPNNSQKTFEYEASSALNDFNLADKYIDWEQLNRIKVNDNEKVEDFDIIKKILEILGLDELYDLNNIFETEYEKKKRICEMLYEFYAVDIQIGQIDKIEGSRNRGISITLKDGTEILIIGENTELFEQGFRVMVFSRDFSQGLYIMSNGDIYSDSNLTIKISDILSTGQYGGNQMDFKYKNAELAADPKIQEIIRQYWPDATEEDIEMFLYSFCNHGCGYVAPINIVFEEYAGREEEFERTFGFPMYVEDEKGLRDYNYEYLIMEFFCWYYGDNTSHSIKEYYGDISYETAEDGSISGRIENSGLITGISAQMTKIWFAEFLKTKYNIDCNITFGESGYDNTPEEIIEEIRNKLEQGKRVQIDVTGGELYSYIVSWDGTVRRGNLKYQDLGGHALYVVDITDSGEIIVASWGKRYILDISDIKWLEYIIVYDFE